MRSGLNKCVLELVKPGYPWQEICGDHLTWLILRRKIKDPELRITAIEDVLLDDFQWKVHLANNENHCYSGNLSITVQYKSGSLEGEELEFPEEAETEETCREAFLQPEKYLAEVKSKVSGSGETPGCTLHTSFPSLLLESPTRAENGPGKHASDIMRRQVQIPWRAKVRGLGQSLEPRIMKVHLAKVGISTMLLEVLLKLEVNDQAIEPAQKRRAYRSGSLGEKMLVIQDEAVQEVLGVAQESGFYSGIADE
ncbi:MAG: hypothetical protein RBT41_06265, partial [Clostridia bacterium]|nr:hypothetical protein [Clostridia bacterium]